MDFNDLMKIYAPWSKPQDDGVYPGMSMRSYHEDMALGSSGVGILQQPAGEAFYEEKYLSERRRPYSEGDDIGSMAHKMVLEPDTFYDVYTAHPDGEENKATNAWREFKKECKKSGLVGIKNSELEKVTAMRDKIYQHPIAVNMLKTGFTECSYFSTCKQTGVREKARPDHVAHHPQKKGKFAGIDYKTTGLQHLGIKKWSSQEAGLGRHIQATHHRQVFNDATGDKMVDFYHVSQMQSPPYLVRVFRIPDNWFDEGEVTRQIAKQKLMDALNNGHFPEYPMEVEDLIDPWSFNSEEM